MSLTTLNLSVANKLVLEAFDSGWKTYQPQGEKFFNKVDPQRVDEKFSVHAADGSIQEVSENTAYPSINVAEIGSVTISQRVFKKEIPVSKLMKRFDNYGVVLREATKQGYRARYVMDDVMADVLNNGFGTTTTWDGLSLFNASHLIGASGSTQSNTAATDISKSTINTAHIALQTQKDHGNQTMPVMGKFLVVHPNDQMTAWEAIGSPQDPTTANRAMNFINTLGIQLVVWPLLDDTDSWFLICDKMFNRLEYLVAIEPTVEYVRNDTNGSFAYQLDFACNAGSPDYLGTYGNSGA